MELIAMKLKKTLIYACSALLAVTTYAQQTSTCTQQVAKATKILKSNSPFKNFTQLFQSLQPCADVGNTTAQNYIGLLYVEGLGVEKDEVKGFEYIEKAAYAGSPIAQGNLGRLYKKGTGCQISTTKAVEWFAKGAANGNSKAAYMLGYMYYKGLGISQNYTKAIRMFKLSEDPMAKHWLGVCYYFGYGVPQNTTKAITFLTTNGTPNSRAFMSHVQAEKKQQEEALVAQDLAVAAQATQKIEATVIEHALELVDETKPLENKDLEGEWVGKFIEYDESGKHVQRTFPIAMSFMIDEFGDLKTKIEFNEELIEEHVLFEDNNLFVDNFNFSFQKQYTHNLKEPNLEYQILGMDLTTKRHHKIDYLLADVDAYLEVWKETAQPISLVLRPKTATEISEEEEEMLLALASQKEEFIRLYPVPFENQLHIQFELEETETVQVTVTGVNNGQSIVVEQGATLQAGSQTYHANAGYLPNGLYVIKVITNTQVFTRLVVKQ